MRALTLKALHWVESEKAFCSPSKHAVWPRDDIMRATCTRHSYEEILAPERFVIRGVYDDQVDPGKEDNWYFPCGCGLYGATELHRVLNYKWSRGSLIFLMQPYGNYDAWNGGLRCQGMRPTAIVSNFSFGNNGEVGTLSDYSATLMTGIDYFRLPMGTKLQVIPYSMACRFMEDSWKEHIGGYWGDKPNNLPMSA